MHTPRGGLRRPQLRSLLLRPWAEAVSPASRVHSLPSPPHPTPTRNRLPWPPGTTFPSKDPALCRLLSFPPGSEELGFLLQQRGRLSSGAPGSCPAASPLCVLTAESSCLSRFPGGVTAGCRLTSSPSPFAPKWRLPGSLPRPTGFHGHRSLVVLTLELQLPIEPPHGVRQAPRCPQTSPAAGPLPTLPLQ